MLSAFWLAFQDQELGGIMWEIQVGFETTMWHTIIRQIFVSLKLNFSTISHIIGEKCEAQGGNPTTRDLVSSKHSWYEIGDQLKKELHDWSRATLHVWLKSLVPLVRCLLKLCLWFRLRETIKPGGRGLFPYFSIRVCLWLKQLSAFYL